LVSNGGEVGVNGRRKMGWYVRKKGEGERIKYPMLLLTFLVGL
jgi:hypothetical protein